MSIKARELRIDNLVEHEGEFYKIHSIAKVFPTLDTIRFGIGVIDWNNINPIPLTEEWLLKMGFDLQYKSEMHSTYEIMNGKFTYYFWYNDKRHYLSFLGINVVCNYVHTLQNIIHSLTGEELTIKENEAGNIKDKEMPTLHK